MATLSLGNQTIFTQSGNDAPVMNNGILNFNTTNHSFTVKGVDAPIVGANYSTSDDANSGQLAIYNGATKLWGINESGGVFSPNNPGCYCRGYAGSNTLTSTTDFGDYRFSIWYYDDVKHNIGNHFDNSTGYFTAPYSGRYLISGNCGLKTDDQAYMGFGIVYNGTTALFIQWSSLSVNLYNAYNGGTIIHNMSAGDYIGIGNYYNPFGAYTVPDTNVPYVAFSVYFLG